MLYVIILDNTADDVNRTSKFCVLSSSNSDVADVKKCYVKLGRIEYRNDTHMSGNNVYNKVNSGSNVEANIEKNDSSKCDVLSVAKDGK